MKAEGSQLNLLRETKNNNRKNNNMLQRVKKSSCDDDTLRVRSQFLLHQLCQNVGRKTNINQAFKIRPLSLSLSYHKPHSKGKSHQNCPRVKYLSSPTTMTGNFGLKAICVSFVFFFGVTSCSQIASYLLTLRS